MRPNLKSSLLPALATALGGSLLILALIAPESTFVFMGSSGMDQKIRSLFSEAIAAFQKGQYQTAINKAKRIRSIELRGRTDYLAEAKQIIDTAKVKQREEFVPFLSEAEKAYQQGDVALTRELCQEMLKRDPAYLPAVRLLEKTQRGPKRKAGEYDEIKLRLQTK